MTILKWASASANPPNWWLDVDKTIFRVLADSCTFGNGVKLACFTGAAILDLGCGTALPVIELVQAGAKYYGVDINQNAVRIARRNLDRYTKGNWHVECADVRDHSWRDKLETWPIVAANLPYLPAPSDESIPVEANGGKDGLRLVPMETLDIADQVKARVVVMNLSTLCNFPECCSRISARGWKVHGVLAASVRPGIYATKVWTYIADLPWVRTWGQGNGQRQVLFSLVLGKTGRGIDAYTALEEGIKQLRPGECPENTLVIGTLRRN